MLNREELFELAILVVLGGQEAAPLLLTNAILLLDKYPAQQSLLRSNPDLVTGVVEEVLRFRPSFRNVERYVAADTDIRGITVKKGDVLTCWLDSANRDERKFNRPEEFDITRKNNAHLAFNRGIHMCLGIFLSRGPGAGNPEGIITPDRLIRSQRSAGSFPQLPASTARKDLPVRLVPV